MRTVATSLQHNIEDIDLTRQAVKAEMEQVAHDFYEEREDVIAQLAGTEFVGLTLGVNEHKGSIEATWVVLIFRGGKVVARNRVGKPAAEKGEGVRPKSSPNHNLAAICAKAPEDLHPAIRRAEERLRPLRRLLAGLGEVQHSLKALRKIRMPSRPQPPRATQTDLFQPHV